MGRSSVVERGAGKVSDVSEGRRAGLGLLVGVGGQVCGVDVVGVYGDVRGAVVVREVGRDLLHVAVGRDVRVMRHVGLAGGRGYRVRQGPDGDRPELVDWVAEWRGQCDRGGDGHRCDRLSGLRSDEVHDCRALCLKDHLGGHARRDDDRRRLVVRHVHRWLRRSAGLVARALHRFLVQLVPAPRDVKQDLRVDVASLRRALDGEARPLQHLLTLFLALYQGALDLVWVEGLGVRQTRQGELGRRAHHVGVAAP